MHSAVADAAAAEFLLLPGVEGAGGRQRRVGMLRCAACCVGGRAACDDAPTHTVHNRALQGQNQCWGELKEAA